MRRRSEAVDEAPDAAPPAPFHAMKEGEPAHWRAIIAADAAFARELPQRVLDHLAVLRNETHAFAIDRLEHALQTATRAQRAGHDEEYVVCALLHDIGAGLAPYDHAAHAAMILKPFVSEQNHWMVLHHDTFQSYHFIHLLGGDRNARNRFRGHAHFAWTAEFADKFDQAAFDPAYDTLPLAAFEPMVRRVLGQRRA